jgi:hypothetical protein
MHAPMNVKNVGTTVDMMCAFFDFSKCLHDVSSWYISSFDCTEDHTW